MTISCVKISWRTGLSSSFSFFRLLLWVFFGRKSFFGCHRVVGCKKSGNLRCFRRFVFINNKPWKPDEHFAPVAKTCGNIRRFRTDTVVRPFILFPSVSPSFFHFAQLFHSVHFFSFFTFSIQKVVLSFFLLSFFLFRFSSLFFFPFFLPPFFFFLYFGR